MWLWCRETGETFHNMITWQDLRASEDVQKWNSSFTLKVLNNGARFAHFFTRRKRHLAASVLRFMSKQVMLGEPVDRPPPSVSPPPPPPHPHPPNPT